MFTKLRSVTAEDRRVTCCSVALKHFVATLHLAFILLSLPPFAIRHQNAATFGAIAALIWWIVTFVAFAEEKKIVMVIHVIVHFIANIFLTIAFFVFTVVILFLRFLIIQIMEKSLPDDLMKAKFVNLILIGIYLMFLAGVNLQYYYTWMCYQLVKIVESKRTAPPMALLA